MYKFNRQCALEHHVFYRLKTAAIAINAGKPQRQNFVRMGSRFRYSGKTEFQSTMIRAQQINQANDNRSTFERRPSQRFASRRSRMDRTRPNIINIGNKTSSTNNINNNNNNNTTTNNNNINHSTIINNNQPVGNKNETNNKQSEAHHQQQQQHVSQQQQSSTTKPSVVMNSITSRHQLPHGKPVKPPTVPSSVSFSGITQQINKQQDYNQQQTKSNQSSVNINNNNNNNNLQQPRKIDFSDSEALPSSKISVDPFDHNNQPAASQNVNSSLHSHSRSQPAPTKSNHNYMNYKPPDAQPPPPPPLKSYDQNQKQVQRMTKSEEKQDQQVLAANRRATRLTNSGEFEQNNESFSSGAPNGISNQKNQGEILSSSSMPPPPPPPHTAPRSISSRDMMSSQNFNKPPQQQHQHQHSQSGLIKPICVTEL